MSSMFYGQNSGNWICEKSAKTDQAKNPQDIGSLLAAKRACAVRNDSAALRIFLFVSTRILVYIT
jgi:hypothetical protein